MQWQWNMCVIWSSSSGRNTAILLCWLEISPALWACRRQAGPTNYFHYIGELQRTFEARLTPAHESGLFGPTTATTRSKTTVLAVRGSIKLIIAVICWIVFISLVITQPVLPWEPLPQEINRQQQWPASSTGGCMIGEQRHPRSQADLVQRCR